MLLTRAHLWCGLGGLLALGACGDFTLVEPQGAQRFLSIYVDATSDETTRYDLSAFFWHGEEAEIVDPALYVEGAPIPPNTEPNADVWSYRWQGTRTTTGTQAELIRVALPVVGSASSLSPQPITIPVTFRTDARNLEVQRGADLVLQLSLANRVTTGLSGGVEFWQLEVRDSCSLSSSRPHFSLHGSGPHPSELRIPWQWLETATGASIAACFNALSSYQVTGSPYSANVGVSARVVWQVNIIG